MTGVAALGGRRFKLNIATLAGVALVVHGVGHVGGWWMLGNSWLLTSTMGADFARAFGSFVWLVSMVGFVGAGLGILGVSVKGNPELWRKVAVGSALVSLTVIVLFAGSGGTSSIPAAAVVNLVALLAVLYGSLWSWSKAST